MLERGFTALAEFHYLHHAPDGARYANPAEMAERVAAAAAQTGIGLTLLPVLYTHGGFGPLPPSDGQRRFLNGTDEYLRLLGASRRAIAPLEDARLGVAPHSLRAVTDEQIGAVLDCGPRWSGPHPRGRADGGGGGLRRVVRAASGRAAPGHPARRAALVRGACHPHDRGGDDSAGRKRRSGGALSHHGGQPGRRRLQRRRLHGHLGRGLGLQRRDHRAGRAADAGVRAATGASRAQPAGACRGQLHGRGPLRRRAGRRARGPAGARIGRIAVGRAGGPGVARARHHARRLRLRCGCVRGARRDRGGTAWSWRRDGTSRAKPSPIATRAPWRGCAAE